MEKKDLLLDVDEVVCFSGFLEAINDFLESSYVIDDFTDYYIDEVAIPKERFEEFNMFLSGRNMYENAVILPKAIETLKLLKEVYNIYVCSSCVNPFDIQGSGRVFKDKYEFLLSALPFIKPENYIFTNAKNLFKADVQIDDRLSKLDANVNTKILFPSYHNKDVTSEELALNGVIRAGYDWRDGWDNVATILLDFPQDNGENIDPTILRKKL